MTIEKFHTLAEIERIARANKGRAPGRQKFESETGIKASDWYPHHWLRWGDALQEAGFSPNKMQAALSDDAIAEKYIGLIRELGRLPLEGEVRRKSKQDPSFPSHGVFARLGGKVHVVAAVLQYCKAHAGFEDVITICEQSPQGAVGTLSVSKDPMPIEVVGFAYLIKSGRHYKIGRTNAVGRRERELAIQLPERSKTVHVIKTDDPVGIEGYWHKRFESKRGNGEWFELTASDVKAFMRRKFM